jgi:hypothetical protein
MPTTPPDPRALAAWLEVLDQIDQTLDRSLALAAEPPAAPETPGLAGQAAAAALGSLDDRLGRIEGGLARAGEQAALADAALTAEVEALEGWLKEARALRERLAAAASGTG